MKNLRLIYIFIIVLLLNEIETIYCQDIFSIIQTGKLDDLNSYIKTGGDVNTKDTNGRTLLIWAAMVRDADFVKLLIDSKADVNLTQNGLSALMAATAAEKLQNVNLLIDAHANINTQNSQGYTALIIASSIGNAELVSLLLSAGADPSLKDNEGNTALHYANSNKYDSVASMLTAKKYVTNENGKPNQLNQCFKSQEWAVTVHSVTNEGSSISCLDSLTGMVYWYTVNDEFFSLIRVKISLMHLDGKPIGSEFLNINPKIEDTEGGEYYVKGARTSNSEFYNKAWKGQQSFMLPIQFETNYEYIFSVPVGTKVSEFIWPDIAPITFPAIQVYSKTSTDKITKALIADRIHYDNGKYVTYLYDKGMYVTFFYDNGKYVGEIDINNNRRQGKGIYTWTNGKYSGDEYIGDFRYGLKHGHGTYTSANGNRYIGKWENNNYNGFGTYTWAGGNEYKGEWADGLKCGQGTFSWTNGDTYNGEWKNDMKNGQGTYTWADGAIYTGEWENNIKHGKGTLTWANGDKYVGEWEEDEMHTGSMFNKEGTKTSTYSKGIKHLIGNWEHKTKDGKGTYIWANGDKYTGGYKGNEKNGYGEKTWACGNKYEGQWENDIRNGQGTFFWTNGDTYSGNWKNDMKNGQGTYTWADGAKYKGEWENNMKHGKGTLTWANDDKYIGEWKNDMKNGQGTYTWADGEKYIGEWKNNTMHNGIKYNKEGEEIASYFRGEIQ